MSKTTKRVRDKWRSKDWYMVMAPDYFGNVELGFVPSEGSEKVVGRILDATLYDITNDFAHQYLKMYFQVVGVDDKTAKTVFKGHEYSRDYLRSLVRRRTTRIDTLINLTTKDGYGVRVAVSAFTLNRVKTSQETSIRHIMRRNVEERATALSFDQYAQEMVLGKIASDIYNEAKKVAPLRHVGIRKSKLTLMPTAVTSPDTA